MTARPHEYSLQVSGALDLVCRLVVERRIMDGTDHLSGSLILELQEVRTVILAESSLVLL